MLLLEDRLGHGTMYAGRRGPRKGSLSAFRGCGSVGARPRFLLF